MTQTPSITDREREVLAHLARFRFLTRSQMERFLYSPGDAITPASRTVMTKRVLRSLANRALIGRTIRTVGGFRGGSGAYAYHLTTQGSRAASRLSTTVIPKRAAPRGTFLLRHALTCADVCLAFNAAAEEHPGHRLIAWECDWEVAQRIGRHVLVPDAHLVYASRTFELHAFIEIDLGTAGSRFFQQKIDRYLDLYRSDAWRKTITLWPTVLTIAPTPTRAYLLKRATEATIRSHSEGEHLMQATEFAFASLPDLTAKGPLAPIWEVAGCDGIHALLPNGNRPTNGKDL